MLSKDKINGGEERERSGIDDNFMVLMLAQEFFRELASVVMF